jgi:hypothetical protein
MKDTSGFLDALEESQTASPAPLDPNARFVMLYRDALRTGRQFAETSLHPAYRDSYAVFANKHVGQSKYLSERYKGRSRLVRPKTRTAVRKRQATAAASLFSSRDVVNITPENAADPMQDASAKLNHAILNYRLTRTKESGGVAWFMTVMGAVQDAAITGVVVSKQFWEVKRETLGRIVTSQPAVQLYPAENVIRDPAADWADQSQSGSYLILRNPVAVHEALHMIRTDASWERLSDDDVRKAVDTRYDAQAIRQSRESSAAGQDRMNNQTVGGNTDFSIVWLDECFMRVDGEQYVYWMLGEKVARRPVLVGQAYPHAKGKRPVAIGVAEIEAHRTNPMSPVQSWLPLQFEANDLTNMALDGIKNTLNPLAKVKAGRGVSLQQVQNRSPDSVLLVQSMDDVEWDRPTDISGMAFHAMDRLNADFDDAAGQFNSSSVQTNRQLNDTVGGMKLMNAGASMIGDFDLKTLIETWIEPCLNQLLLLEQYYEDDPVILSLAAQGSGLVEQGLTTVTDALIEQPLMVHVDVGMGATDPQQRIARFTVAWQAALSIFGPAMIAKEAKRDMVLNEIFALAGYKEGKRFFNDTLAEDPRLAEMAQAVQQLQGELASRDKELETKLRDTEMRMQGALAQIMLKGQVECRRDEIRDEKAVEGKVIDHALRSREGGRRAAG